MQLSSIFYILNPILSFKKSVIGSMINSETRYCSRCCFDFIYCIEKGTSCTMSSTSHHRKLYSSLSALV